MTYTNLRLRLREIEREIAEVKAAGDILVDARIDSSKPGGTSVVNPSKQYRLRTKGGSSRYLKAADVPNIRAAILRGKQFKKLEKEAQKVSGQLSHIEQQAAAMGLNLPLIKSHDCSVMHSSESNEWYTLAEWVNKARELMGGIDLDPASNEEAQSWIQAQSFYTREQDGMQQPWFGRMWLNPPYGRHNKANKVYGATAWIWRTIEKYESEEITQAVLWLRVSGNQGIQALEAREYASVTLGRIDHAPPGANGKPQKGAGHDTVVYYLGPDTKRFKELFKPLGLSRDT